jgi:hypothetical protein
MIGIVFVHCTTVWNPTLHMLGNHVSFVRPSPDLGQLMAEQAAAKNDERQAEAVREAEKRVWAAAKLDKQVALDNLEAAMRIEHDRGLKKLGKAHTMVLEVGEETNLAKAQEV